MSGKGRGIFLRDFLLIFFHISILSQLVMTNTKK